MLITNFTGSGVRRRISTSMCFAASTLPSVSITVTPSLPITNPAFAEAGDGDFGLSIAAQACGATCFSVNGGSIGARAQCAPDRHAPATRATTSRTMNLRCPMGLFGLSIVNSAIRTQMVSNSHEVCG